jgi:hypothetical protein
MAIFLPAIRRVKLAATTTVRPPAYRQKASRLNMEGLKSHSRLGTVLKTEQLKLSINKCTIVFRRFV